MLESEVARHVDRAHGTIWVIIYIGSVYFLFGLEWLTRVVADSFLTPEPWFVRISVLISTPLVLLLPLLCILLILLLVHRASPPKLQRIVAMFIAAIPAFAVASSIMLLVDGALSEVFFKGLYTLQGYYRLFGIAIFLALWNFSYGGICATYRDISNLPNSVQWSLLSTQLLGVVFGIITLFFLHSDPRVADFELPGGHTTSGMLPPNILLLGGDGISATATSLFINFKADTTPFLRSIKSKSLFVENAFAGTSNTPGSIPAMLSGRSAFDTGIIYSPDIFRGVDAYKHLPRILRAAGYRSASLTSPYVSDQFHMNMRDGFDESNQTSLGDWEIPFVSFEAQTALQSHRLFLVLLANKLQERFLHILMIRTMYLFEVVRVEATEDSDTSRLARLRKLVADRSRPWFIHIHLLGTHGRRFFPHIRKFSLNLEQSEDWMHLFYEDAILEFDERVKRIFEFLEETGQLEKTIVVVNSDHGFSWGPERTPLLFFFPKGEHIGVIHNNVSHLDIAPTILDYLGIAIPPWMTGVSLLRGEPPRGRQIPMVSQVKSLVTPPPNLAHNLAALSVVQCAQRYVFDLVQQKFGVIEIAGHTSPCDASDKATLLDIKAKMEKILVPRYLPTIDWSTAEGQD